MISDFNRIQDGGRGDGGGVAKRLPTGFSPVTSANVEISPKNFLTFSVLLHWFKVSRPYLVLVPNY